jgi:hypothetical protein
MSSFARKLCAVALVLTLSGCRSGVELTKPHRVHRQDLAGSTYVTVLSIAPWDDYIEALQPKFTMTADTALSRVIPTTQAEDERFLQSISAALKLATPTSKITTGPTSTTDPTIRTVEEKGPGDASKVEFKDLDDTELPEGTDVLEKTTLEKEPILQHLIATALFQEVQLLNRYVTDAATRTHMVPYVVRIQITVMPEARNEPYDAYSNLSFFLGAPVPIPKEVQQPQPNGATASKEIPSKETPSKDATQLKLFEYEKANAAALERAYGVHHAQDAKIDRTLDGHIPCTGAQSPSILPLFVTDNIEGAMHAQTAESVRQLMGALAVLSNNFSGSASARFRSDMLRSVLGRDLNSLLTVGRVNDNTLRVRLGAVQAPTGSYAMVPQTHNVTLLLMVPDRDSRNDECRDVRTMRFLSRTSFVDAKTGQTLPERSALNEAFLVAKINQELDNYGVKIHWTPVQEKRGIYLNLVLFASTNNRQGFRDQFQKLLAMDERNKCKDPANGKLFKPCLSDFTRDLLEDGVWMELVNLTSGSQWHIGTLELPEVKQPELPPLQRVLLLDDGKKSASVTLPGGTRQFKDGISAKLVVITKDTKSHEVKPIQIDVPASGDSVKLTFTSPAKLIGELTDAQYQLTVDYGSDRRSKYRDQSTSLSRVFDNDRIKYAAPEKEAAGDPMKMTISSRQIRAEKAEGTLNIEFERDPKAEEDVVVRFDVSGADVVEVTSDTDGLVASKTSRVIKKNGVASVKLRNLSPTVPVVFTLKKVTADGATAFGEPVTLTVLELQSKGGP